MAPAASSHIPTVWLIPQLLELWVLAPQGVTKQTRWCQPHWGELTPMGGQQEVLEHRRRSQPTRSLGVEELTGCPECSCHSRGLGPRDS